MYSEQAQSADSQGGGEEAATASGPDADAVDAEFEEVKDDDK